VRETDGVVNFVYEGRSPAVIKEYEIDRIKKFLDEYDNVEITTEKIKKNQRVQIDRGLFVEKEGIVLDLQNKKAKVAIESIGYTLVALFDQQKLKTNNKK
jgi:transcription antitermination factor NusG